MTETESPLTYLEALTTRLASGAALLSADFCTRHANYLKSQQNPDGGFRGRADESDLYYTGFALRGLALVDALDDAVAGRAADFLRGRLTAKANILDFLSLLYGALLLQTSAGIDVFEKASPEWPDAVAQTLERLRRADGGYAKSDEGAASSTYHSFLVVLCLQLIAKPIPSPERLAEFIQKRQRDDGGFVEMDAMRRSGTNPTSAAIALLRILGALTPAVAEDAREYLLEMQSDEGGLLANTRIFVADVLSTFTGLLTLDDLGALDRVKTTAVEQFLRGMELPDGGFRGASLDPAWDVEYTFYGLGGMALLAKHRESRGG